MFERNLGIRCRSRLLDFYPKTPTCLLKHFSLNNHGIMPNRSQNQGRREIDFDMFTFEFHARMSITNFLSRLYNLMDLEPVGYWEIKKDRDGKIRRDNPPQE